MKRIYLILVALVAVASSSFAASYKGFVGCDFGVRKSSEVYGSAFGISTSHGAMIDNNLFVGGGFQVGSLNSPSDSYSYSSIFIDGRYRLLDGAVSPQFGLKIGPAWNAMSDATYLMFSPSAGVTFDVSRRFGFDINLSYEYDGVPGGFYDHINNSNQDYRNDYRGSVGSVMLNFGIHF